MNELFFNNFKQSRKGEIYTVKLWHDTVSLIMQLTFRMFGCFQLLAIQRENKRTKKKPEF